MTNVMDKLALAGLIPVIKVDSAADAVPLCRALKDGGLPVAEITFRTAAAEEAIRLVKAELPDVMLGAGTVLNTNQADRAVKAGATYIVSPGLNPAVVGWCMERGLPVLPGCANPSDIEAALGFGLDTVKFFPAEALGGVKMIKAMSAPYGGISFVPTGGVNEKNVRDYLSLNCVKAVGGSWMVPPDAVEAGDWARITKLAADAVNLVLGFEVRHVGINCENADEAARQAGLLSRLMGWPVFDHAKAIFVGEGYEVMKSKGRGRMGHIAVATNSVERAVYHMTMRGFKFEPEPVSYKNGKPSAIYLQDEIAGFAIHLLQK